MGKKKVKPTKLKNIFNSESKDMSFDVNTPQFIKEAAENCHGGMYAICWQIFKGLLIKVAERAIELDDPVLSTLMIRLNLYEIPNKDRYKIIRKLEAIYKESAF